MKMSRSGRVLRKIIWGMLLSAGCLCASAGFAADSDSDGVPDDKDSFPSDDTRVVDISSVSALLNSVGSISDLKLWYDGSDSDHMELDGSAVAGFYDLSGSQNHAAQSSSGSRPTLVSSAFNSLSAVDFDGSDDLMTFDGSFLLNTKLTVFAVMSSGGNGDYAIGGDGTAGSNRALLVGRLSSTRGVFGFDGSSNVIVPTTSLYTSDTVELLTAIADDSGKAMYVNGKSVGSDTSTSQKLTGYPSATIGRLQSSSSGYQYLDGRIAEILIFTSDLSQADRIKVNGYLSNKWDLDIDIDEDGDINSADTDDDGDGTPDTSDAASWDVTEAGSTVTLSVGSSPIAEDGGSSTITATLSKTESVDVTVNLAYSGTAISGTDYATPSASITIPSGQTSASAGTGITATADTVYEGNETVIIDISSVSGGTARESGTQQQTLTITDAESAPTVTLSTRYSTIDEDGGATNIIAALSHASASTVTVSLAYSGTATSGTDYGTPSASITIPAGQTSAAAGTGISSSGDTVYEGNETVIIDISSVTGGSENGVQRRTVTITDAESAPEVSLSASVSAIAEASGTTTLTVSLDTQTYEAVTVNLAYSGTATSGTDYGTGASSITIAAGQSSNTATLTATQDTDSEGNETIIIDIASVSGGGASEDGTQQRTVTITDDDNVRPTLSSFSAAVDSTAEDTAVEITFAELAAKGDEADGDGTVEAFVVKSVSSGSLSINGSAWAGTTNDRISSAKSASWTPADNANGSLTAFTVVALDNSGSESSGSVAVQVSVSAVNDSPLVATNTGVTLNEGATATIPDTALDEGDVDDDGAGLTYTVTLAPGHGRLELSTAAGVTISSFTQDDVDNSRLRYVHDGSEGASDSFGFSLADAGEDGASAVTGTFNLTLTAVNDAPEITNLASDSASYNFGTAVKQVLDQGAAAGVSDPDSSDFDGGTLNVSISSGGTPGEDLIGLNTGGTVALAGETAGSNVSVNSTVIGTLGNNISAGNALVVNLNGNATPARVAALLGAVFYQNTNTGDPATANRGFQVTLSDGDGATSRTVPVYLMKPEPPAPSSPSDNTIRDTVANDTVLSDPVVGATGVVNGGTVSGRVVSQGLLQNVIVDQGSSVDGGRVAGNITNRGTLNDVSVEPDSVIQGGRLGGTIASDGTLEDVGLAPGATVSGGRLRGEISGDLQAPAWINATVENGTRLSNVVVGRGSTLEPGAELGSNVRFETLELIPENLDLSTAFDKIPWEAKPGEVQALNLEYQLALDSDQETLIQGIARLDQFSAAAVMQEGQSGELVVQTDTYSARVVPVSVRQAGSNVPRGTSITEDGDIGIVTGAGQQVLGYPTVDDEDSVRGLLARNGLSLDFDQRANLVIGQQAAGSPDPLRSGRAGNGQLVEYMARAELVSTPAAADAEPGLDVRRLQVPARTDSIAAVFEDESGAMLRQELVPVPADWLAVKQVLRELPGAKDVRIGTDGIISVTKQGRQIRGRSSYAVLRRAEPASGDAMKFEPAGDLNGDGVKDYYMVFPNGDLQRLYILPQR